ncbi:iron chelate uptake ABC transporter family permease subunit [Echinicola vietnamensis]|uniref:ABC-type Mn2+/Zn2+ transport system, permease component n=1 Tax=Echinicola vietnamensis (strain DSM 17526 / LMG 23754 / KMM 6221) TaxID=926556 RepID=L0G2J1_ECHVK|nr:iron chelate uptake ABC transporter family permease subunit [Echinicola vietnamensis]AGA79762.1 ABC-type Mn2+/Zn2+ transport system, permease component [Echinicola vietnamensis DSM 17526]
MEEFIYFFSFQDPNVLMVVTGIVLLSISAAMVGTFTFLDKKALVGDAISHAVLPGVCLAFMFSGSKNPFWIVSGAFVTGALSTYTITWVSNYTKLKEDTVIASILSIFFGVGIVMMTQLQQTGNASLSGLDHFIFGNAISIVGQDLWVYGFLALAIIMVILVFYKEFQLMVFNRSFAESVGLPVKRLEFLFNSLMVLAVVTGIQAIGVVLMAALLITPAAAAKFWTNRLSLMLVIAVIFSVISGITGAYISFVLPHMPTGPWVVMVLSLIAFLSFFFSTKKGIMTKWISKRNYQRKIHRDHILKALFAATEQGKDGLSAGDIFTNFPGKSFRTQYAINKLNKGGYINDSQSLISLTQKGHQEAGRIVRLHRLWELYMTEYMNIAPDHVHDSAEKLEHIITPELERQLDKNLNFPQEDPHQSIIPRDKDKS